MSKGVYFIGNEKSFIVNAMVEGIRRANITCDVIAPDPVVLEKYLTSDRLFIFHVDEDVTLNILLLNYVSGICTETDAKFFLIGYPENLNKVKSIIPKKDVWDIFEQPISATDLAARISYVLQYGSTLDKKKHILVVDDQGTALHTIKAWLEKDYKISLADSAVNGVAFLRQSRPDLILLDYEMPICTGAQMYEALKQNPETADIPVIFLTAKDDRESVEKVLALRPAGYILKSLPADQIVRMVNNFFEKNR